MKLLWCWRCRAEMPMLDDYEWAEVAPLYNRGFRMGLPRRREGVTSPSLTVTATLRTVTGK